MILVKDIITPRKEVIEGKFQGVVQSHKVDSPEERIESRPELLFPITYPSNAMKLTLERVNEKMVGKSNQGAILLIGPYGSGKTHALITLYHIFKNPRYAMRWLKEWRIDLNLPEKVRVALFSSRKYDVDLLWEPIFKELGREDILKEIKRFPTVDQIEEVIGTDTVAIFLDEIENWYGSFNSQTQADLIERNETFLEHLLEVAADPSKRLLVFITFLEEKAGLKKIFNRTKPVRVDVAATGDKENIALYRLFENALDKDRKKVSEVVNKYVENYKSPIEIGDAHVYTQQMIQAYPFHSQLLNVLEQIYESATERQDIRGIMGVLADAVQEKYDKQDMFLLCDLDENAFQGINLKLVEKFRYDVERVKDISYGYEILKSILIFTLNEKTKMANVSDIMLSVFKPTQGQTLNQLLMDLENLPGTAFHLHYDDRFGTYMIKETEHITAIVEREKRRFDDEQAVQKKVAEVTKKEVFDNKVFIYQFEEVPDDAKIKIVIALNSLGEGKSLQENLEKFYHGRTWQNTIIFVVPNNDGPIKDFAICEKAKRLLAAESLLGKVEDEKNKLNELIFEERKELADRIRKHFGRWVKWTVRNDELTVRLIPVSPDVESIREKASADSTLVADAIIESIKDKAEGVKVEFLLSDFKKMKKFPLLLDDETFYLAIRKLHQDKRIAIEGDRGKWFIEESPATIELSYSLFEPRFAPSVPSEEEEPSSSEVPEGVPTSEVEFADAEKREITRLNTRGNSPRVILSNVEARTSETDLFSEIDIKYKFARNLNKQEIMKFIKLLPSEEETEIEVNLEVKRKIES
jgi:hypothetical protein